MIELSALDAAADTPTTSDRPIPLPTDLLLPCMRLPRGPLQDRAATLTTRMRDDLRRTAPLARLVETLNQVALTFAEAGDRVLAERVCHTQLALCARDHEATGDPASLVAALQPWINLGRLRVLSGDPAAASTHFALATAISTRSPVRAGPVSITAADWAAITEAGPQPAQVAAAIEVTELSKALLRTGHAEDLRPWLSRWLASPLTRGQATLQEARICFGLHTGQGEAARRLADDGARHTSGVATRVFAHYVLLADTALGLDTTARALRLADSALRAAGDTRYDTARLVGALAEILLHQRADESAVPLLRAAAELAAAEPDEPLHARLLLRVAEVSGPTPPLLGELRELCANSRYAEVHRRVHDRCSCRADHGTHAAREFLAPLADTVAAL
ncbi:hypothetical protein ACTG9Q_32450 [Actinokineospora sp. 24-640]